MTPTEQDKELREKLRLIARWGDYEENGKWARGIANIDDLMHLVTQYGDTREREGRESVERDHRCPRPVSRGNKTYGAGI